MSTLTDARILELLRPFAPAGSETAERLAELAPKFGIYLELLLRWNARTNLTAIREPEEMVQRHFGESVFAASVLEEFTTPGATLLDFGSGAGFPGLPIQLCIPDLKVCLAESQGKKASFLREAVRTLGVSTEVWASRVETMPAERRFDFVALRAVDKMDVAVEAADVRVASAGKMIVLSGEPATHASWVRDDARLIPLSKNRWMTILRRG